MARSERRSGLGRRLVASVSTVSMVATGFAVTTGGGVAAAAAGSSCQAQGTPTSSELNSTTGITSNSVSVGNVSILSGPVPGLFQGAPYGAEAYFAYVNSTGGVNGRKINLKSYDDAFSGTQNQAAAQQSVNSDFGLVGSFSLYDNYTCNVLAKNPAVPDVSVTLDPGTNSLKDNFSPQPLALGAPQTGYAYIKKHYPNAIKHVANLVSNVDTAIAQWGGQQHSMENLGYHFSYVREVSPLETNFTTDVVNMKNKGVQMVLLTDGDWQIFSALVKAMNLQNFHPQVMFSAGPIYDPHFIPAAGGAKNTNGIYLVQGQSLYLGQDAKNVPAVATFDKWIAKTHPGFKPDLFTVYGWSSAALFTQALRAAGTHPTRGKVLAALGKITNFSANGLVASANPAKKIPPNCVVFAQIKNGNFARIAPTAKKGFDCSGVYYGPHGALPKVAS